MKPPLVRIHHVIVPDGPELWFVNVIHASGRCDVHAALSLRGAVDELRRARFS